VDELFTRQSQSLDPAERRKLVSDMEKQALEGVPRVVLFWWSAFVVHWPQVRGYVMAGTVQHNQKLQDVWLAQ
ncbi:MAG: ABC transporter substrate-binding protein, partial [Chloroflexota bacterium]|nr:ABC transporter substrate-binding protein [Chloroflexota bacterium]